MGVTTEVWRFRIGAFLPVLLRTNSDTPPQSKHPLRKHRRTYKRPPLEARTHHVTVEIFMCLVLLAIVVWTSVHTERDPPFDIRQGDICVAVMTVKMGLNLRLRFQRTWWIFLRYVLLIPAIAHSWTSEEHQLNDISEQGVAWEAVIPVMFRHRWVPIQGTLHKECISAALRLVLLALLLICGDVESNPGPNDDEQHIKKVPVKKIIRIKRVDRGQTIGIGVSSLEELNKKILGKWPDLKNEKYTLWEDETEVGDEDYFLSLEHKSILKIQLSEAGTMRTSQLDLPIGASAPVLKRHLSDNAIHEIALNRLRSIRKLGFAMGFSHTRVSKYEEQNKQNLMECLGTTNMILDWLENVKGQDQVKELCNVLVNADLNELAGDLEGYIFKGERTVQSNDMLQLQRELERYYVDVLCFTRTIPWKKDSAVQISDFFKPLSLFHLEKTSKRDSRGRDESHRLAFAGKAQTGKMIGIFNSDDNPPSTETMTFLNSSHNGIFTVKQNGVCPRRFLVTGDPGVGKSTLLLKLAHDWAVASESSPLKRVQILIHLTLKGVPQNSNLGEEIKKQILPRDTTLGSDKIEQCIRESGDVVILLDGFDESEFASLPPNQRPKSSGSLYDTIKFEIFRNCRVLVSVRPWKESHFRGDLFNPYAVVFIGGLMSSSINEFIHDYCNKKHSEEIHSMINKDLTNLRPILRVPLFLAMICEMISDNTIIRAPFTLSNLISQFCKYLFKQFKNMDSKSENDCLTELGKLALNSYVLKISDVSKYIEDGLKVGLLSKGRVKYLPELGDDEEFYFAHSLLRDYCVAKYLSKKVSNNLPDSINELMRNFYVLLFQCGMSRQTLEVLLNHLNAMNPKPRPSKSLNRDLREHKLLKYSKELLAIQCYFENQGNTSENFEIFRKLKCIVIPMDVLNALAAVKYLLTSRQEAAHNVNNFVLFGENYVNIVDSHVLENTDEYTLRVLHIGDICSLISRCSNITSMYLADMKITLQKRSDDDTCITRTSFISLNEVHIVDCQGCSDTLKSLLHHMSMHFPGLQFLGMQNLTFYQPPVQQQGVDKDASLASPSPEKLMKDDITSFLKEVAPSLEDSGVVWTE